MCACLDLLPICQLLIFNFIWSTKFYYLLWTKDAELCNRYEKNTYNILSLLNKKLTHGRKIRYFIHCQNRMNYIQGIILNIIHNHSSSNLLHPQAELFLWDGRSGKNRGGLISRWTQLLPACEVWDTGILFHDKPLLTLTLAKCQQLTENGLALWHLKKFLLIPSGDSDMNQVINN